MIVIELLASAAGAWITAALGILALLILSTPRLLGLGFLAGCRRVWTLMIPSRRAQWLQQRREKQERHQRVMAEAQLLGQEKEQYGRDEAMRRALDRMRQRTTGTHQDEEPTA